jgi:AcrR family transcriptional regulator
MLAGRDQGSGEAILDAAMELFAERGYSATTTRAIADRARVNEVTLFRRFGSKAGILGALTERQREATAGFAVTRMPEPEDVRGTLEVLARLEVDAALTGGALAMRLAMDARSVPEVAEAMSEGPDSNLQGLTDYLADRQEAGVLRDDVTPALMAEVFFAVTSTLVMTRQLLGHAGQPDELGTDEMVDRLVELFWSGVRRQG